MAGAGAWARMIGPEREHQRAVGLLLRAARASTDGANPSCVRHFPCEYSCKRLFHNGLGDSRGLAGETCGGQVGSEQRLIWVGLVK